MAELTRKTITPAEAIELWATDQQIKQAIRLGLMPPPSGTVINSDGSLHDIQGRGLIRLQRRDDGRIARQSTGRIAGAMEYHCDCNGLTRMHQP